MSPQSRGAEDLYPVSEVAEKWRCSPQHIYNLIAAGLLAATQIGKGRAKTRISESSLSEFLGKNTSRARRSA